MPGCLSSPARRASGATWRVQREVAAQHRGTSREGWGLALPSSRLRPEGVGWTVTGPGAWAGGRGRSCLFSRLQGRWP